MKKKFRKGFEFRLKPSADLLPVLSASVGAKRFVWNKALAMNMDRLRAGHRLLWFHEMSFWLTLWKKSEEYGFLKEAPSQPLQQALKHLDRAFRDAFDKQQPLKQMPCFKRRYASDSLHFPQGFKLDEASKRIYLPKLGWMKYRKSCSITGTPKNVTLSRRGNHWYISIQTEWEQDAPKHPSKSCVGLDLGVARFVTLSTGEYFEPVNAFKKSRKTLKRYQRRLRKKERFSANWRKLRKKISARHARIANIRKDHLHKVSTTICKSHALVVVENLKVKNMTKSAQGTSEDPSRNVKAKSGLNRSILDQGWGNFVLMLEYKLEMLGGMLVKVDPKHTSQTCLKCGHKSSENRKTQATFACKQCEYTDHADYVGALNVLARGHRVLACGENSLEDSAKQEPVGSGKGNHNALLLVS